MKKFLTPFFFFGHHIAGAHGFHGAGDLVNSSYTKNIFSNGSKQTMPYRLLSPDCIEAGCKYPLVVFLHGHGERGTDNEKQLIHGGAVFTNPRNQEQYPAFVVFPQCNGHAWTSKFNANAFLPDADVPDETLNEKMVMGLISELITTYPIDIDRIYLMGISMGAIATYDLTCRHPEVFAAAVPICGAVNPERLSNVRNINFMIFHGQADSEVPVICSRQAYKTLRGLGANVDYIELDGAGHECWHYAFNHPRLLPWLFAQERKTIC